MLLQGDICTLRAVEPRDGALLYRWENDTSLWEVSGTTEPFSRYSIDRFVEQQQEGIVRCGQLRLMIDDRCGGTVGAIDLFDFDPKHGRAGLGILIYDPGQRRRGYAAEALRLVEEYGREVLGLHQLWCNILTDNEASLALFLRAGFRQIGVKRDWVRTSDGYKDEALFQKML